MRFVGLALISALAASEATWGCQNAPPPSPGVETPSPPASAANSATNEVAPGTLAAGTAPVGAPNAIGLVTQGALATQGAPPGVVQDGVPSRVTRIALPPAEVSLAEVPGSDRMGGVSNASDPKGNEGLLATQAQRRPGDGDDRLLQDPLIGDTLIGDGEPMDDVDDAASGVAEPDPDQAGAPEPPRFPRTAAVPTAAGAGPAEPRGTAPESQKR